MAAAEATVATPSIYKQQHNTCTQVDSDNRVQSAGRLLLLNSRVHVKTQIYKKTNNFYPRFRKHTEGLISLTHKMEQYNNKLSVLNNV